MGKKSRKLDPAWDQARRRCRLSAEEVRMAKELGFKPRSLIKNIPSKSQRWKAPVNVWIRDLYAERFGGRSAAPARPQPPAAATPDDTWEELDAQWDTISEEPYFVRRSDGKVFTMEEAGAYTMKKPPSPGR